MDMHIGKVAGQTASGTASRNSKIKFISIVSRYLYLGPLLLLWHDVHGIAHRAWARQYMQHSFDTCREMSVIAVTGCSNWRIKARSIGIRL